MKKKKYGFTDYKWSPAQTHEFVKSFHRYSHTKTKKSENLTKVFDLFINDATYPLEISWDDIYSALEWDAEILNESLTTRKSTLVNRLKNTCLEMSKTIDPMTVRPFNHLHFFIKTKRKVGIRLCKLLRVKGVLIEDFTEKHFKSLETELSAKESATMLNTQESHILKKLRAYLQIEEVSLDIIDSYAIKSILGKGSSGKVYTAVHLPTKEIK